MITQDEKLIFYYLSQEQLDNELIYACRRGDSDIVQYLLTSPNLIKNANIHSRNGQPLVCACAYGHLEIVKYLLTSPELREHADIHADNDESLVWSCICGFVEIIKYLLKSPELKEHANIHANESYAFKKILQDNSDNIVREIMTYLIFDYNIETTTIIKEFLISKKRNDILNMFEKRDFKCALRKKLKNDNKTYIKIKI